MVFHFFQPWATIQPLVFSFAHSWLLSCPWFSLLPTLGSYSALGFSLFPSLATIQPLVFHFNLPLAIIPPLACIQQVRVRVQNFQWTLKGLRCPNRKVSEGQATLCQNKQQKMRPRLRPVVEVGRENPRESQPLRSNHQSL